MELVNFVDSFSCSCDRKNEGKQRRSNQTNIWMSTRWHFLCAGFDVWQMQTVSISPQSRFTFHLPLHFDDPLLMGRSREKKHTCSQFSIFPVFSVWFIKCFALLLLSILALLLRERFALTQAFTLLISLSLILRLLYFPALAFPRFLTALSHFNLPSWFSLDFRCTNRTATMPKEAGKCDYVAVCHVICDKFNFYTMNSPVFALHCKRLLKQILIPNFFRIASYRMFTATTQFIHYSFEYNDCEMEKRNTHMMAYHIWKIDTLQLETVRIQSDHRVCRSSLFKRKRIFYCSKRVPWFHSLTMGMRMKSMKWFSIVEWGKNQFRIIKMMQ